MSSSDDGGGDKDNSDQKKIRLNKVFKRTHSRREADRLIEEGRVSINGDRVVTKGGFFVIPYVDKISLDGSVVKGWEEMNFVSNDNLNSETKGKGEPIQPPKSTRQNHNDGSGTERSTFEYIKYWKPRGVICTTDLNIPGNIIDEMREHDGYDPPHRVYPVGRLDKETTGIILLTSDGRLPNAALRKQHKRPKIYEVMVDPPIGPPGSARSNQVLDSLSTGVVISTETVRNGVRKTLTAPTEPCTVEQLTDQWIRITLKEGRNRQVRKMTRAVGHRTVELERVSFAGIPLEPGLRGPGDWDYLKEEELEIVRDMIRIAAEAQEEEDAYWESD
jgi:23S rRNA pseudouridine2604 synthase